MSLLTGYLRFGVGVSEGAGMDPLQGGVETVLMSWFLKNLLTNHITAFR